MKLKITIGRHSGFCFGVKRAYDLACKNSSDRDGVFILGKLVHNNDVCRDIRKRGIKEIESINVIKEGAIIFTAHGVGPGLYKQVRDKGLRIIDTTCPKVMKTQRLAKVFAQKDHVVLVFGDKKHKEVKSIFEWSGKKAKIIGSLEDIKKMKLDTAKQYCLISQTTQNVNEFRKIVTYLKKNLKDFLYFNTICPSTNDRQREVQDLARKNDAVIVIGGKDSANSRMLFQIAKKLNRNTYFIENVKELKSCDLKNFEKIAISAGASTPEWTIKKIVSTLENLSNCAA